MRRSSGPLRVAVGVVGVRGLDHPREQRRLREGQVAHVLVEVHARGLAHAVDAEGADLAEVDLVQVQLQDVLLVGAALQHEGEQRLLGLAPEGALGGQEEVLHELLGDGAAALDVALGPDVPEGRPHDPEGVEARVAEEAPVLDGQHGLDQVVGQLLVLDEAPLLAALVEEVGDQLGLQRLPGVGLLGLRGPASP